MTRLLQDLRYGLRMLVRNPGFTAVAVLTMALGIGATTAIFSVVYGVLLRPLPYSQPDRLVALHEVNDHGGLMNFADPNFEDVRASSRAFDGVAEYAAWMQSVAGASEPTRTMVARVSRDFFPLLRVQPGLGRAFVQEDQRFGAAPVALVSYAYWQQYLGSASDLSRIRLTIENRAVSVVGVLPAGFRFPMDSDIWEPRELSQPLPSRTAHNWHVLARLRDGVRLAQAHSELAGIARRLKQQYGRDTMMVDVSAIRLQDWLTNEVRKPLYILLAAVGFLLLVACANVANLLLAHVAPREREVAIRVALGAGRIRLVVQFLTEVLLVALSAGGLGVLTAQWGVDALLGMSDLPQATEVSVNLPVLLFALAVAVGAALSLGLFAAWHAASGGLGRALAERSQGYVATLHSQRLGRAIVAGQLAITLVLLVGAGLLGRSLLRVLSVDPGFRTDHILTVDLALPAVYDDTETAKAERAQFLNTLVARLRALPGVQDVGGTAHLPLTPLLADGTFVVMKPQEDLSRTIAGLQATDLQERTARIRKELDVLFRGADRRDDADYCPADGAYFRALRIPLRRGRLFDERDTFDSPQVALISESLARRKWPHEDPLGQTIEFGNMDGDLRLLTVVGVVGDVRQDDLETLPPETIYVNYRQRPQATYQFTVVMRTSVPPAALLPPARKIVRDLAPDVPPQLQYFQQGFFGFAEGTPLQPAVGGSLCRHRLATCVGGCLRCHGLFGGAAHA